VVEPVDLNRLVFAVVGAHDTIDPLLHEKVYGGLCQVLRAISVPVVVGRGGAEEAAPWDVPRCGRQPGATAAIWCCRSLLVLL
jgi:hypothetical protein